MKKVVFKFKKAFQEKILRRPTQVLFETTNKCNLNCPYCMMGMQNELVKKYGTASHSLMKRPLGMMGEETFNAALKSLKEFGIQRVYLHFHGEPFLNPLAPLFAKVLKQNKFQVGAFTNGLAFTDKNIKEIADANLDLIRFSVDGASKKTYEQNRVGGNFDRVIKNMEKLVAVHRNKMTRIEWQMLVLKNNEHEVDRAKSLAQKIGVNFFVKGFRETDSKLAPLNPQYRSKFLKKPCKDIYHQLCIQWNGDVVPCCYDIEGKEVMGNLTKDSLTDIWENRSYKDFRKRVNNFLRSPEADPGICRDCLRWK